MLQTAVPRLQLQGFRHWASSPTRFQTEPQVCYEPSWQLPDPDFHRQATSYGHEDQLHSG